MAITNKTPTLTRPDAQIQRDVLAELKWDARLQPNEIGVAVKDGIVTLVGWVDSYSKLWAAEDAAKRIRGVKTVANDIDRVKITVSNGWVTLEGEVDWKFEGDDAERAVRKLTGVKGITNLIKVKSPPTRSELKQKIERPLARSAETDADRIAVEVVGSKVILKGTVRSLADKQEAERVAWSAPGVNSVDNRITISPQVEKNAQCTHS
jgi:osmotically-inducible protein OsmY